MIFSELKRKLEMSQQKISELESRQKDTLRLMSADKNTDKKFNDMELQMGKLRQQVDSLTKRLKEEGEKKLKLEKDLEKEQSRVKELEIFKDKQQQILKKKTEDLLTAQRRLRSNSSAGLNEIDTPGQLTSASKHWVEQEMEKIILEKRQMEQLKDELAKREALVKKKEHLLSEKNDLEVKKLRASQLVTENNKTSMRELEETHSNLMRQRKQIDDRIHKGDILSPAEERRLIEVEEAIEALESAIEFENDSIVDQENKLKNSMLFNSKSSNAMHDVCFLFSLKIVFKLFDRRIKICFL
jgi:kinesin family protein 7